MTIAFNSSESLRSRLDLRWIVRIGQLCLHEELEAVLTWGAGDPTVPHGATLRAKLNVERKWLFAVVKITEK